MPVSVVLRFPRGLNVATRHVLFCDLDGTLVLDNSFHVFLAAAWTEAGWRGRFALALILGLRLAGRAGGGHRAMKRRVMGWFARQPEGWQTRVAARTAARLRPTVSQPVLRLLEEGRGAGGTVVLATAAPAVYARLVADWIGAAGCIASDGTGQGFVERLGQAKADACQAVLAAGPGGRGGCVVTVLTDHADDLPLLEMADRIVLQAGKAEADAILRRLPSAAGSVTVIDPDAAQADGGYWLWFDDRPVGPLDLWEVRMALSKHRHAALYAGGGRWRRILPGDAVDPAVRRTDCPRPPSSSSRLRLHLGRRVMRDFLGIYH